MILLVKSEELKCRCHSHRSTSAQSMRWFNRLQLCMLSMSFLYEQRHWAGLGLAAGDMLLVCTAMF